MGVTFHATTSFGMTHVILKTTTCTRTLKGGGFGLTRSQHPGALPTVGSFEPSRQWRHKSQVSVRGSLRAHGLLDTFHGEMHDRKVQNMITSFYGL